MRSRKPAAAVLEPAKTSKRPTSAKEIDRLQVQLASRREQVKAAARWAFEKKCGSKRACHGEDSPFKDMDLTYNMVEPLLRELKKTGGVLSDVRSHHSQILIDSERLKLAEWILACADRQDPKDRVSVSAKVREMLRARHKSNKQKRYGKGSVRLNEKELDAVQSKTPRLSHTFFTHFYPWCRAHGVAISEGVYRAQD